MTFKLQILHASDLEGGVPALEDAPRFSAVVNGLKSQFPEQTLILSSGDNYILGPFFAASGDRAMQNILGAEINGRGDIAIANAIGFQAAAFGNHEFDDGTGRVKDLIAKQQVDTNNDGTPERVYPGTNFPYLSSNLDFTTDSNLKDLVVPDGQEASTIPNSIAKSTIITVAGEKIGIIGATTPLLPNISSPGGVGVSPSNPQDIAIAAAIQPAIDTIAARGINKIILLAHMQQLDIEQALAPKLRNVDVIIAGGSHTLLADASDRLRVGDTAAGVYPILTTSATGEPIAILNTTSNYKYVGRLVAEFDHNGKLIPTSIDPSISGAYATDQQGVIHTGNFAPAPKVVEITNAIKGVIYSKDGNIFGKTDVFLNGARGDVRTQETNFGNLTADANLFASRQVDPGVTISIKNGGGIRDSIGAIVGTGGNDPNTGQKIPPVANPGAGKESGEISQLDIENSLRFNNSLTLLTLTAAQLQQVIEHGVAANAPGRTPGQFPQVGGMAFSFDPNNPPGQRVKSLVVKDANGNIIDKVVANGQLVGDRQRKFRVVTLYFLANGSDEYPFPAFEATSNRVDLVPNGVTPTFDTFGTEQKALADYLRAIATFNTPDLPPELDERIQNLSLRSDTIFFDPPFSILLPSQSFFTDSNSNVHLHSFKEEVEP